MTNRAAVVYVVGLPAPQGSKKGFYNKKTKRVQMVESSSKVKPWREAVKWSVLEDSENPVPKPGLEPFAGGVSVTLVFYLPRPRGHYRTGVNSDRLRPSAPRFPSTRPDIDKLARSTLDGLKDAGLYEDDSRVVDLTLRKRYADHAVPGCAVKVSES